MIFEYNAEKVFTGSLDVDDPGNMCIRCMSLDGDEYFIFTKTCFGKVSMMKVGPIIEGIDTFLDYFSVEFKKFDFRETLIQKDVQQFINDPKKKIQMVDQIDPEDAFERIPDLAETFKNIE